MFKRIHFIAIGGAAMHNLAIDLHQMGHHISGSDDEIYEPSLSRLRKEGIAPAEFGWFADKITHDIDYIILGMHARIDNPELLRAQELKIQIYSYPELVYKMSEHKKRIVVAGSHGKTTTTAMILHVLKKLNIDFDYLVGAQISGFDKMVKLSDAPIIIIEGDEYLSSPIDRRPKIHHYKPHISVITGIAWDHINVFPTFEDYVHQFKIYLDLFEENGVLIYYEKDSNLNSLALSSVNKIQKIPYGMLTRKGSDSVEYKAHLYPISVIGNHNLQNLNAALLVCQQLGIVDQTFFEAIKDFTGANKRLQRLNAPGKRGIYLDFAHAPSKVKATTDSLKEWFGDTKLLAVLELHTFSSLNAEFLPQYKSSLDAADEVAVFYSKHALKMKKMPDLDPSFISTCFDHKNLKVFDQKSHLMSLLEDSKYDQYNILMMTSGNFDGLDLNIVKNK